MFAICGVFAEFECAMIVERVRAGLRRAQAKGTKSGKQIGPPQVAVNRSRAQALLAAGRSLRQVARVLGVSPATLHRAVSKPGPRRPSQVVESA